MRRLLLAAALVLTGCAIYIDDDETELERAVAAVGAEVNLHHANVESARTLDQVAAELTRHRFAIADRLDDVSARLDDCWGYGMSDMRDRLRRVEERVDAYLAEMGGMVSMPDAMGACDRYGDDMDDLLGRMMNRPMTVDCNPW